MKTMVNSIQYLVICAAVVFSANTFAAAAPITRVALFKNGVVVVARTELNLGPECLITDDIKPIHGTLWFSDMENLTARTEHDVLHISRTGKV